VTLGSSSGFDVVVQPHDGVRTVLTASLGKVLANVTYRLQLEGWMVAVGDAIYYGDVRAWQFNQTATVLQNVDISSYGKDSINVYPYP
jgi:hypothetical protein